MNNDLEERKSLKDVFYDYRHYLLEDYLNITNTKSESKDMEEVETEEDCIMVDLSNKINSNIEQELQEED